MLGRTLFFKATKNTNTFPIKFLPLTPNDLTAKKHNILE